MGFVTFLLESSVDFLLESCPVENLKTSFKEKLSNILP